MIMTKIRETRTRLGAATRRRFPVDYYVDGIVKGDRAVMGRALWVIESDLPCDHVLAQQILDGVLPRTGRSRRIGISGVPGSGKSTLIDSLGIYLVQERSEKVAVLSVDPSSPISGGSILGAQTRLERLGGQSNA